MTRIKEWECWNRIRGLQSADVIDDTLAIRTVNWLGEGFLSGICNLWFCNLCEHTFCDPSTPEPWKSTLYHTWNSCKVDLLRLKAALQLRNSVKYITQHIQACHKLVRTRILARPYASASPLSVVTLPFILNCYCACMLPIYCVCLLTVIFVECHVLKWSWWDEL